jgi:hypothetical protein
MHRPLLLLRGLVQRPKALGSSVPIRHERHFDTRLASRYHSRTKSCDDLQCAVVGLRQLGGLLLKALPLEVE